VTGAYALANNPSETPHWHGPRHSHPTRLGPPVANGKTHRHEATPEIWQETYLSAILRGILYSDDPTYYLEAYRRLAPIPTPEAELRFLQAAEALFAKGWQVGSDPEIQVATVVSNHLTAGIMKYFGDSGRFQRAANLFEKLYTRDPEVAPLLARSYIGMSASHALLPAPTLTAAQTRRSRRCRSWRRR
jgi:hypothetical protein